MKSYLVFTLLSFTLFTSACSESAVHCDDLICDDGNACTTDSCDPDTVACLNLPVSDGTACTLDAGLAMCEAAVCVEDTQNNQQGFPDMGRVVIHLDFAVAVPTEVFLEATCANWIMNARFFETDDGRWRLIGPLPSGTCEGQFVALDAGGATLCTAATTFAVEPGSVTAFDDVIVCDVVN